MRGEDKVLLANRRNGSFHGGWIELPIEKGDLKDFAIAECGASTDGSIDDLVILDSDMRGPLGEIGFWANERDSIEDVNLLAILLDRTELTIPGDVISEAAEVLGADSAIDYAAVVKQSDKIGFVDLMAAAKEMLPSNSIARYPEGDERLGRAIVDSLEGCVQNLDRETLERYFDYRFYGRIESFDLLVGERGFIQPEDLDGIDLNALSIEECADSAGVAEEAKRIMDSGIDPCDRLWRLGYNHRLRMPDHPSEIDRYAVCVCVALFEQTSAIVDKMDAVKTLDNDLRYRLLTPTELANALVIELPYRKLDIDEWSLSEAIGRYIVRHKGLNSIDTEQLIDYFDYERYGQERAGDYVVRDDLAFEKESLDQIKLGSVTKDDLCEELGWDLHVMKPSPTELSVAAIASAGRSRRNDASIERDSPLSPRH